MTAPITTPAAYETAKHHKRLLAAQIHRLTERNAPNSKIEEVRRELRGLDAAIARYEAERLGSQARLL